MIRFDATGQSPVDKWTAAPRLTTSPQGQPQQQKRSTHMVHKPVNSNCSRHGSSTVVTCAIMCQAGKGYSLWLCKSHEQEHPDVTANCDD